MLKQNNSIFYSSPGATKVTISPPKAMKIMLSVMIFVADIDILAPNGATMSSLEYIKDYSDNSVFCGTLSNELKWYTASWGVYFSNY